MIIFQQHVKRRYLPSKECNGFSKNLIFSVINRNRVVRDL